MTTTTLSLVAPACPDWCTSGPHEPTPSDFGCYAVTHVRDVDGLELSQWVEHTAAGEVTSTDAVRVRADLDGVDLATAQWWSARLSALSELR
jgi:hypothetical protein